MSAANDSRELCEQCRLLFSSEGFPQLFKPEGFKHSLVLEIGDRKNCKFCSYMWDVDLNGTTSNSSSPSSVKRLSQLPSLRKYGGYGDFSQKVAQATVTFWARLGYGFRAGLPGKTAAVVEAILTSRTSWVSGTNSDRPVAVTRIDALMIEVRSDSERMLWAPFNSLNLISLTNNPCAVYTSRRPITWQPDNPESLKSLKPLLSFCSQSHSTCSPISPKPLPSRVIRVTDGRVKLHVTAESGEENLYTALSYCWGGPQLIRLTSETINAYKSGIEFHSLPRTLQDAITVTRYLGIDYIWVDALCIIQNDENDKKREIAKMCDIYENSVVTINAATAKSVNEGFLRSVPRRNLKPPTCEIDILLGSPTSNHQYGRLTVAPNCHPYTEDFPIHQRGWTFQEYLIPPRLLVFGYLEPFYLCRKEEGTSLEQTSISYNWGTIQPRRFTNTVYYDGASRNLVDSLPETLFFGFLHQWPDILYQYTRREFGFMADRPHAIRGVIDFICRSLQTSCHFGIFESWPVDCLLWKTSDERISTVITGVPSWSWMAVTGAVDMDITKCACKSEALATWDSSIEDHSSIRMRCRLLRGQKALDSDSSLKLIDDWPDVRSGGDELTDFWSETYPPDVSDELYFIRLSIVQNRSSLVMIASKQLTGTYRRHGLGELTYSKLWDSVQLETITVI